MVDSAGGPIHSHATLSGLGEHHGLMNTAQPTVLPVERRARLTVPFSLGLVVDTHPHTMQHAATLRLLDDVHRVYPCSLGGEDLGGLAGALGPKARPATGLDELLLRSDVDALLVAVRNDLCPDVLRRAVEAGKPVLFEKPGAPSAEALRAVADLARARRVTLGAMLPWRYHPISREVHRLVQDGALGRVMAVEARLVTSQVRYRDPGHWLFRRAAAGSGILSWLGIHWLDLISFLIGQRVRRVVALTATQNPEEIEVEDAACLALEYEGGALGTLQAGYLLPGSRSGYLAAAYDNYLAVRGYDGWVTWPHAGSPAYTLYSIAPAWAAAGRQERRFELPPSEAYAGDHGLEFVRDFLHASRASAPAPCPIEDAVYALEVIEAALRASATGTAQEVGGS